MPATRRLAAILAADMDADAPLQAAVARNSCIALRRELLQCQTAFDGADHRAELDQHPVAGGLDDPPAMLGDQRIGGGAMLAQCLRRADPPPCRGRRR